MIQVTHHSDCTFPHTYVHMHETRSFYHKSHKKVFLQVGFSFSWASSARTSQAPFFPPTTLGQVRSFFSIATMLSTSSMSSLVQLTRRMASN